MKHAMSPDGVAGLFLLALLVDYISLGPEWIRDRLAFLLALPAFREGFNGSPLDHWTVGALSGLIDKAKEMGGPAYWAGATTNFVVSLAVVALGVLTFGALLPEKLAPRLGKWVTISFPTSGLHRINWKLWACALLLGMLADLPRGGIGDVFTWFVDTDVSLTSPISVWLFEAAKA